MVGSSNPFAQNTKPSLSDEVFSKLREIIHDYTGITIAENRRTMLISRLQQRLRASNSHSFLDYIEKVLCDEQELQEMINRVTTNETYFYRTPRIWSHIREVAIPNYLENNFQKPMRVWSAAASTGEEAYSMAIVLEQTRMDNPGFEYSVLGTDISTRVLKIAKIGFYSGRSVEKFKMHESDFFHRYMSEVGSNEYSAQEEIRSRIAFRLHNLLHKFPSVELFDIVFLRNVLIYFSKADQERVLRNIHDRIHPSGILIIGESETLGNLSSDFSLVKPLIYRSKHANIRDAQRS